MASEKGIEGEASALARILEEARLGINKALQTVGSGGSLTAERLTPKDLGEAGWNVACDSGCGALSLPKEQLDSAIEFKVRTRHETIAKLEELATAGTLQIERLFPGGAVEAGNLACDSGCSAAAAVGEEVSRPSSRG